MFGLFKRKEGTEVTDRVYMSDDAKTEGLKTLLDTRSDAVLLCWFPVTRRLVQQHFPERQDRILQVGPSFILPAGTVPFFAEHFPSYRREQELFLELALEETTVYSALTEPLFDLFGGQKIIQLARQMGYRSDEAIENKLVSGAIVNAQKKLDARVLTEISADSQAAWMDQYQQQYQAGQS